VEHVQFANPPIVVCSKLVALKGIKSHLSGLGSIDEELTDNVDNIFQIKAKDFSKTGASLQTYCWSRRLVVYRTSSNLNVI
jgi:hypothetical protein